MSIYNKTFPNWVKGDDNITQGSGYSDNVSIRNDGKTELRGDTYITNSGRLMINKDKNTTTNFKLDVEGNVNFNNNSLLVKNILYSGDFILGNLTGTNTMTSLTLGSQSPYQEYILNNAGGLAVVNIWARRLGIVNIGSYNLNNNMDVFINGGQSKIQIGNGASGASGIINLGSTTTNYTNTVNICSSSSIANTLNLGSSVSNININGQLISNSFLPSTTITTGFTNNNFITKLYADTIYQTISGLNGYGYLTSASASNLYQPIANMGLYQLVAGMNLYLTTTLASTTYQPITNMSLYQLVSGMNLYLTTATASSTYQPITNMSLYQLVSGMNLYLTTATASTTYQPITNMALYQLVSSMNNYLTTASASTTYQPITNMSLYQLVSSMNNYLTTASASTTYQTITNMSLYQLVSSMNNYLTTASASSTYQTVSGMNLYLSSALAAILYQPISNMSSYQLVSNMSLYQLASNMSSYLTTVNATLTFQPITNMNLYSTLSANNYFTGNNIFQGQYINKLTYLTGSTTYTLSSPFYSTYLVDVVTSDVNIYLPALSTIPKGVEIRFLIPKNSNVKTLTINRNISTEFFISYDGIESYIPLSSIVMSNTKTYISIMAYDNTHWYITSPSELVEIFKDQDIYGTKIFKGDLVLDGLLNFFINCDILTNGFIVTNSQLGYLSGTTSNIQNQFSTIINLISNYAVKNQPTITAPSFRSTTQSQGGLICGFQSLNGDSRFNMFDENYNGIQPAQIHTQAGYGLGINAQYGTVKIYQNSVIISEFASTGQNTLALTINNRTKIASASSSLISGATTLTYPLHAYYSLDTTTAYTITLPTITANNVGTKIMFRRVNGANTNVITFTCVGQSVFNSANGTTTNLGSGLYIFKIVSMYSSATTFAWYYT